MGEGRLSIISWSLSLLLPALTEEIFGSCFLFLTFFICPYMHIHTQTKNPQKSHIYMHMCAYLFMYTQNTSLKIPFHFREEKIMCVYNFLLNPSELFHQANILYTSFVYYIYNLHAIYI